MSRLRQELVYLRNALLLRLWLANLCCALIPPRSFSTARARIYRTVGFGIAPRVAFVGKVTIRGSGSAIYKRLRIGAGSLVGEGVLFNLDAEVNIGANVSLGPGVSIYTSTHLLGPGSRRMTPDVITRPVRIGDGAWIGVGSVLLPGADIGCGAVVGAGSVVSEPVAAHQLVAGNPARTVQELPWADR